MKAILKRQYVYEAVVFTALFVLGICIARNLSFNDGKPRGKGVFASDRSIYYVYLPATFIYGWDVKKFPHRCDTNYRGFILDYERGRVINKMTCGVALLWTPFFLVTHAIATTLHLQPDGFSDFYQKMAIIPPVFFLVAGLFFLRRFLLHYIPPWITWMTLLFLLAGTNLYYYAFAEGLMSHVHSFFLFALFLFLLKKFLVTGGQSWMIFAGLSAAAALAILVRPTNLVILLWFFLLDTGSARDIILRLRMFFQPKFVLSFMGIAFIVFLPQFIYWKYAWGSFIHYSYGSEGFTNWRDPVILPVWFSPFNGLFLYNPIVLLFVAGAVIMVLKRQVNGWVILATFFLVTYLSGSWHMWFFGGSFGSRPFVEYYALFALGFGYFLERAARIREWLIRVLILLVMTACCYYNVMMTHHNTWYTGSVWDWDLFKERLSSAGIIHLPADTYTFRNDYENISSDPAIVKTNLFFHSSTMAAMTDSRYEFCGIFDRNFPMTDHPVRHISASLWVNPVWKDSTGAILVATIEDENRYPWIYRYIPLNRFKTKTGVWTEITAGFDLPLWLSDPAFRVRFYLWNQHRRTICLDDVRITME